MHVCQPTDGGAAAVTSTLSAAGVAAGYDVTVVCPAGGFLSDQVTASGARWIELDLNRSPELKDVTHARTLRRLLPTTDVLHLHSSKAGAVGRMAAASLLRRPRVIFTPHGWSWYVGGRSFRLYQLFERLALRVTSVVTVVSAREVRDGRAVLGRRAPIALIENGVDTSDFSPVGEVADRRPEPLLVQVGRLSTQKGQDRSLRALSGLTDSTVRLRFVGDGPLRQELVQLADKLDVSHRVEFVGSTDPRPHLRAADLVLLPSRWEGMSLALLEAMSTGATIIAVECGGTDALGSDGVVIPNTPDEHVVEHLSAEIEMLLADRPRRIVLGGAARIRAQRGYDVARAVAYYERVWQGVTPLSAVPTGETAA